MTEKAFGIDISKWQGTNDFAKMKANTSFVFVKATESWGYTDSKFVSNWQGLAGHNRGAYCYVWLSDDPLRQANHLIDTVTAAGVDWQHDRLVLDLEKSGHGLSKAEVARRVIVMMGRIKEVTGRYPILYSRADWVNDNLLVSDPRIANADWWLAGYLTRRPYPLYTPDRSSPPPMPNGVNRWLVHQTAEHGNGSKVGVGSYYVDTNRWNGIEEQVLAYFGRASEIPDPEPEPAEPLYKAEVIATAGLRVRSAPVIDPYNKIDVLSYKTVVDVYEESNGWSKISDTESRWCASQWLKKLEEIVVPPLTPIGKFKIISDVYINVRSGAGTEHSIVRTIKEGEIVDAYVITSKWLLISPDKSEWIYKPLTLPYEEVIPGEIGELDYLYYPFNERNAYPITQKFGANLSWYPNSKGHNGIDWGIAPWNEIFSARAGKVIRADYNADGYGRSIWIQHFTEDGKKAGRTIYGHLKQYNVKVGDVVDSRQLIGWSNGELTDPYRGFSTGAHLHFEYRWDKEAPLVNGGYKYWAVDPLPLLRSWDLDDGKPLEAISSASVRAQGLYIRSGAGVQYRPYPGEFYRYGDTVTIYQELNGWARVSPTANRWVSSDYIKKI